MHPKQLSQVSRDKLQQLSPDELGELFKKEAAFNDAEDQSINEALHGNLGLDEMAWSNDADSSQMHGGSSGGAQNYNYVEIAENSVEKD